MLLESVNNFMAFLFLLQLSSLFVISSMNFFTASFINNWISYTLHVFAPFGWRCCAVLDNNRLSNTKITASVNESIQNNSNFVLKKFKSSKRDNSVNSIQALTKYVPRVGEMSRKTVEASIDKSISKMGVSKLDCLQLHWWDYKDKRYMDALKNLSDLQSEGKIGELSLTNFDTKHLEEILKSGISISTNQVQYSILDQRPTRLMKSMCDRHSVKLLAYGTLCGGLLSEKYLGKREPTPHELNTPSLGKYKQIIDQWGGWSLFQDMLRVLDEIAKEHNVSIANVATRYILNDKTVASVLIGCRFGMDGCDHAQDNYRSISSTWSLTAENLASIKAVQDKSNNLFEILGDCGSEYR